MNKLFLVLLALCLASSVHAFVRREAPATEKNYLQDIEKSIKDITEDIKTTLNSEDIQKKIDEIAQFVKTTLDKIEPAKQ